MEKEMATNEGIIKWTLSTVSFYTSNAVGTLLGGRDRDKCSADVASRIWLSWLGTKMIGQVTPGK